MRRLLLVVAVAAALAGCGRTRTSGPAWPAPSTTAEDGGESIAPRPSATYASAVEKSADAEETTKPEAEATGSAATTPAEDNPDTTPAEPQLTVEDVFESEEIIIEIEE